MSYSPAFQCNGLSYFGSRHPHKASQWKGTMDGPAVILGNGESRREVDLWELQRRGLKLFACNSYYLDAMEGREPFPDFVGAVDNHITYEIYQSGYANDHWFLVTMSGLYWIEKHKETPDPQARMIEWDYNANFNCGVEMAQFALVCGCEPLYLLGFDGPGDVVNNVYKERTNCFATEVTPQPGRWQMQAVLNYFHKIVFQVGTEWMPVPRIEVIP